MNKTALAIFMLVIGFTLGFGTNTILFTDDDDLRHMGERSEVTSGDSVETDQNEARENPIVPRRTDRPAMVSDDSLSEIIKNTPMDAVLQGNGTIRATIVDDSGAPIPNVELTLSGRYESTGTTGESMEEKVSAYIRRLRWAERASRTDRTDDAGVVFFTKLSSNSFQLKVTSGNYKVRSRRSNLWNLSDGADIKIVLVPHALLPIKVLMPDGSLAESADISFQEENTGYSVQWSSSNPIVKQAPGDYTVTASVRGRDAYLTKDAVDVSLQEGNDNEAIVLQLVPKLQIRCTVVSQEIETHAQTIRTLRFEGNQPDAKTVIKSGTRQYAHEEQFTIDIKDPGLYAVVASENTEPLSPVVVVEIVDRSVDARIELNALKRENFVEVRINRPEDKKIRNLRIISGVKSLRSNSSGGQTPKKRGDGIYWVRHGKLSNSKPESPRFYVEVTCNFGSKRVFYEKNETSVAEIVFTEPAVLEVQINGIASGMEDKIRVTVVAIKEKNQRGQYAQILSKGKGVFEAKSIQPGRYLVELSVEVKSHERRLVASTEAVVKSGSNVCQIAMPPLYKLTVKFDDSENSGRAAIRRDSDGSGGQSFRGRSDIEDGAAEFNLLPAGEYVIETRTDGMPGMMSVSVPSQRTVEFKAALINCFKVARCPEGSQAYDTGLRSGDVLIGVGGKEFENMTQMQVALVSGEPTKSIMILRGSQTMTIKMNIMKVLQGGGASLRPSTR